MTSQKTLKFSLGLRTLLCGIKEIFSDFKVFIYSLIPMLITCVMVYFLVQYGWDWSSEWAKTLIESYVPDIIQRTSWAKKAIYWIVNGTFKILMILALTYISFVFIQLISIPFYTLICERILYKRGVYPQRPFRFATWFRQTVRLFIISLIRMGIFLTISIVMFIISFIPGLQLIAAFYSALVIAFDGIDYTLEIYEMSLGRRIGIYFDQFSYFAAVGLTLLPFLFIPGLILLLLPATVVGMCVQFAETQGKEEYEKLIA